MSGEAARPQIVASQSGAEMDLHAPTQLIPASREKRSVEGIVQVVIMLAIGTAAGAGSFTHVHDVAAAHGQAGWLAWADAVVLELMSIASGLELRRRKRAYEPVKFPAAVMGVAVVLSLGATAHPALRLLPSRLRASLVSAEVTSLYTFMVTAI